MSLRALITRPHFVDTTTSVRPFTRMCNNRIESYLGMDFQIESNLIELIGCLPETERNESKFAPSYPCLHGITWIQIGSTSICMDSYGFALIHMNYTHLYEFVWSYIALNQCIWIFTYVFAMFVSLVQPTTVPQAFFASNNRLPSFWDYVNSVFVRFIRVPICMDFATCLKRRAPGNHQFGRY